MLRIAICDDSAPQVEALAMQIRRSEIGELASVETYSGSKALLEALKRVSYDILFLDITLPDGNGIDAARCVNRTHPRTQIIFVTGCVAYSNDVCEVDFTYFLSKPVSDEKLTQALRRALTRIRETPEPAVLLSVQKDIVQLRPNEIIYCERNKRVSIVVCKDARYETAMKLSDIEGLLPGERFHRCHNSYLVNFTHMRKLSRSSVTMDNGATLSISRRNSAQFRAAFFTYLGREDPDRNGDNTFNAPENDAAYSSVPQGGR